MKKKDIKKIFLIIFSLIGIVYFFIMDLTFLLSLALSGNYTKLLYSLGTRSLILIIVIYVVSIIMEKLDARG